MALSNAPTSSNVNENWLFDFTADNNDCMEFSNGDSNYLNFGDILEKYNSFTIELWIFIDTSGSRPILSLGHYDSDNEVEATNSVFNLSVSNASNAADISLNYEHNDGTAVNTSDDDIALSLQNWHHIAATRDDSDNKVRIYLNGVIQHTSGALDDPEGGTSTDVELLVGRNQNYSSGNFFDGKMAHIRIWNVARQASEILHFYKRTVDSTASGLVAYWKLDEGVGDTVFDSSSNSNNGTVLHDNKDSGPGTAKVWAIEAFDQYIHSFGLATSDTTVDENYYPGVVINKNISIRDSIDITKGRASTSNITLKIANTILNGVALYKRIFNGTNNYLNKNVRLYAQFDGATSLSNCQKIFTGRLVDIQLDQHQNILLKINSQRPWDKIRFPQVQAENGVYQPVVYGNYEIHGDKDKVRDHANKLYPVPFKRKGLTEEHLIITPLASTDIRPCYYDSVADAFLGIKGDNYVSATKDLDSDFDANVNIGIVSREMRRRFYINPVSLSGTRTTTINGAENMLLDRYNVQGMTLVFTDSNTAVEVKGMFNFACELGKINTANINLKANVVTAPNQTNAFFRLRILHSNATGTYYYSGTSIANGIPASQNIALGSGISINGQAFGPEPSDELNGYTGINFYVGDFASTTNLHTVEVRLKVGGYAANDVTLTTAITDMLFFVDTQQSYDQDRGSTTNAISSSSNLDYLYLPVDGFTALWDNDAITHGHDIHRDLLIRYAGISTDDPTNWAALNTDRAINGWLARYWQLEPIDLKVVLDKLAYEFGFCYKIDANGKLKYIHVLQTSEYNTQRDATDSPILNFSGNDLNAVSIQTTGLSEVTTKMDLQNHLHPAQPGRYYNQVTNTNASARAKYNLGEKEGLQQINLDQNVATIPTSANADCNADWYSYYNNIFGDIKILVSCDVVNPAKGCQLETGDVVTFTNMPVEMFGTDFSTSTYFMIIETKRSPGKVSITAREVG